MLDENLGETTVLSAKGVCADDVATAISTCMLSSSLRRRICPSVLQWNRTTSIQKLCNGRRRLLHCLNLFHKSNSACLYPIIYLRPVKSSQAANTGLEHGKVAELDHSMCFRNPSHIEDSQNRHQAMTFVLLYNDYICETVNTSKQIWDLTRMLQGPGVPNTISAMNAIVQQSRLQPAVHSLRSLWQSDKRS